MAAMMLQSETGGLSVFLLPGTLFSVLAAAPGTAALLIIKKRAVIFIHPDGIGNRFYRLDREASLNSHLII